VKADLRKALDRIAALEEKQKEGQREEVLFRGKPAAYWVKALKDHDPSYRAEAVHALAGIGKVDRAILPALAGALEDHDDDVIGVAAQELAGVGKPAVPYLIDALKRPGQRNRPAAMDALGAVGPDARAAVPALLEALKGGGQAEREAAAMALGRIGPGASAAVPALVVLVRGSDPGDRMSAAVALGGIGPAAREAVPALVAMLKDQELPRGRVIAAIALGKIGPDAKPAVPALLGVLRNPVPGAGELPPRAFEAIEKIDPETAAKVKRP
jgi:HEAT repeat protein